MLVPVGNGEDTIMSRARAKIRAKENVDKGHFSFSVRSAEQAHEGGPTQYLIATRYAQIRSGIFGRIGEYTWGGSGNATRFGAQLFAALRRMPGVEPSLNNWTPHVLGLYVDIDAMSEPPKCRHSVQDLPENICVVIEQVILENRGPIQRLAEYLRRLF